MADIQFKATTTTETRNESRTYTTTIYSCPKCEYTHKDQWQMRQHYAQKHSFSKKMTFGPHQFFYFETQADATIFLAKGGHCHNYFYWHGAGWYYVDSEGHIELAEQFLNNHEAAVRKDLDAILRARTGLEIFPQDHWEIDCEAPEYWEVHECDEEERDTSSPDQTTPLTPCRTS